MLGTMNLLALIALVSFLIYVYLGTLVYLKHPENDLNRTFFLYSVLTAYMCLTDFQMRMAANFETAHFWFRIGVFWHLILPAMIHFVFVFTRFSERRHFGLVCIPMYAVGFAIALLDFFGNYAIDGPKPSPWGWSYGGLQPTLVGNLVGAWNVSLVIVGIVFCLRHYLRVDEEREKQQSKFVLIGISVPMIAGIMEIFISIFDVEMPDLLLLSLIIGSAFLAFAIWKYELFVLSPFTTVKEIIQTMSDALFLIDPDRRIKVVNQAAMDLFGYERHELIDQPVDMLFEEADFQRFFNGPFPGELARRGFFSDAEISVKSKTGRKIAISLAGSLIRDKDHKFQGVAFIGRDITRRKLQEQELRRYQEQLEEIVAERTAELEKTYARLQRVQKLEFMGTIAGGVAHDLNNILSGIVSYPELLLIDLPEDSPMRKPLLAIQKTGEKAATIVTDMLALARREVLVKSNVNLNRVVEEYMQSPERLKIQSYHPGTEIVTELDSRLLNMSGSSIHLSKALMNLVHNGLEAMPGGGRLCISTENRKVKTAYAGYEKIEPGSYVTLSVADTGIGIAPADIERIFEPFYSRKQMDKSGTGLGMSVIWAAVKDHDGYVDLTSREDKGTTITLYFPESVQKEAPAPRRMPLERYKGKGETVLVVDDVADQRDIACSILNKLGYKAQAVASGEAAVAFMKESRSDILLLDMIMKPGIGGLETYRQILALHPNQKAVIASGYSESDQVEQARALGAGGFVRKPYSIETIGMAIRNELDKPVPAPTDKQSRHIN
jgi:PAS domain S-box-containing protein